MMKTPHPHAPVTGQDVDRSRRRTLVLTAATPLVSALGPALWPAVASAQPQTLDDLARQRAAQEGVGLALARVDGQSQAFGFGGQRRAGDAGSGMPDADDLFEIGSITKTFTALLLADMALRKEVALDEALEQLLGGGARVRDSRGEPIRLVDLATHRSGLPRLATNMAPADAADPYADYGANALRAFLADWRADKPRDTAWAYSNLGFGLLGEALAARLGGSYEAALRRRVLEPLGLQGMALSLAEAGRTVPARRLQGHDAGGAAVPGWRFQAMAGAGALLGSARHLARYAQAALGLVDTPLAGAFALALKPHGAGPSPANPIGLAWLLGPLNGRTVANHDGGTFGFASSLWLDPERRRASLALANAAVVVKDVALHTLEPAVPLRDVAAEKRAREAQASTQPAQAVAALAGSYALNPQFKLAVRADGSRLFAQATGQGEFELFARSAREWFARVTPLRIVFDGEAGAPPSFMLYQAGQALRFVRE